MNKLMLFLAKLPEKSWNYESWVNDQNDEFQCGTVCCAAGWMPAIDPKEWRWTTTGPGDKRLMPLLKNHVNNAGEPWESLEYYFSGLGRSGVSTIFIMAATCFVGLEKLGVKPFHVACVIAYYLEFGVRPNYSRTLPLSRKACLARVAKAAKDIM